MAIARRSALVVLAGGAVGLIVPAALAQRADVFVGGRTEFGVDLAAAGYDVVAYHTQNQSLPGTGQFRISWKGAEWRFASQQNRDLFVAEPDKFAPQYGGWCAFAVAQGAKAPSDPRYFDIVAGKLYLNQNAGTQSNWRRDQVRLIPRGDQNWLVLINR